MLHLQVVSPGLSAPPRRVRVTVRSREAQLDTSNTRAWGFGFEGTTTFTDSTIVFESTSPFRTDDSAIILLRFDKGLFEPLSIREKDFREVLDVALNGASFADDEDEYGAGTEIFSRLFMIGLFYLFFIRPFVRLSRRHGAKVSKREKRRLLGGISPDKVDWYRDIPMDGDLQMADYVLRRLGENNLANNLPLAEILRLIYQGNLEVTSELASGKVEISFSSERGAADLSGSSLELYKMLKEAAGSDNVLQDKEFSRWASKNDSKVYMWSNSSRSEGAAKFRAKGFMISDKFTKDGQAAARELVGLKKFLEDFTLVARREAIESRLWKDYLVYAALFGIADKVAKQLKDIDPKFFEETFRYDYMTFSSMLTGSQALSRSLSNAIVSASRPTRYYGSGGGGSYSGSRGGYGGHTSRGGGGGYSGGGRGGGGR